ncbi:MAG TPA: tRNA pseudouridine(55) synthase TruB [Steroidobacteraceae bacterium]|nr:tRNA pseudouridine(55) synthase TruB [Steroidobacteraceae bacterium]
MPSGILLLDKPRGLTSNAALQRVRTLFQREKAGHVGSLDPLATGMLPICLGEATKIAADILAGRKCYRFTVRLGTRTATADAEGEVIETAEVPALAQEQVARVLVGFIGRQEQVPPMYSAIKRAGRPLYALAREGITVPRAPRKIELFGLSLLALSPEALELEALCSPGTYIRVLAEDIARALGTLGHIAALRRLYVEPFEKEPMLTLDALEHAAGSEREGALLSIDWPLAHLPAVYLPPTDAARLRHGQSVIAKAAPASPRVRLYEMTGRFLGIGAAESTGAVRPRRLLNLESAPRQ